MIQGRIPPAYDASQVDIFGIMAQYAPGVPFEFNYGTQVIRIDGTLSSAQITAIKNAIKAQIVPLSSITDMTV